MELVTSDTDSTSSQSTSSGSISQSKKLLTCEVCAVKEAKYTCPRCEVRTCCVSCSAIHKKELRCSGMRDCTKFIPIHKFNNIDFSRDYRFLEQINRNVQAYKKGCPHYNKDRIFMPKRLWLIQKLAETRKTYLKFLPHTFVRHKQNSTHYSKSGNAIVWHVEWVFATESFKIQEKNVPEDKKLCVILEKYFARQEDKVVQDKLQFYQAGGLTAVNVYLKAEEKAGNKFYELDLDETLRDNLRNKIIIEYPIIHVVLKDHSSCYELVTEDADLKLKGDIASSIIRQAESDESIYKSMKNLLFVSDMSDEDIENTNSNGEE